MDISQYRRQSALGYWLRTGQLPLVRTADGRELKFNPYHDPRNGRFTFAPGGPAISTASSRAVPGHGASGGQSAALAPAGPETEPARGSNIRAFEDPMTLEQAFPGLRNAPGGAIIAVADNALDLFGPGEAAQVALLANQSKQLTAQIKAIDPTWHYD
jgi:hypothetical protein